MAFMGATIGAAIAARLSEAGLRSEVRALPAWPSQTSEVGVAIAVEIAGALRPIALVETWRVRGHGPPSLRRSGWGWRAPPVPEAEIAAGLAALAREWARHEEEIGLLDVTFALLESLPPTPGGWRATVTNDVVWIGVERGGHRWPLFVHASSRGESIEVVHEGAPPSGERRWRLAIRADFDRMRGELCACIAQLHTWCEHFVKEREALEKFADRLCVELGRAHLPPYGGHWSVWSPEVVGFNPCDRPTAWIEHGSRTRISADEAGAILVDGVKVSNDTPFSALADMVAAKAAAALVLREGDRYRLKQPLGGFKAGDLLRFRGEQEIRPTALRYEFEAVDPHSRRGAEHYDGRRRYRGLVLSDVEDASVMESMGDWFAWAEDDLDPAKARARRVESLVAVGKHLREHGELDAARARFAEALALDPNHEVARRAAGW